MFPVVYCTHIVQTNLMLKNEMYPQKSTFRGIEGCTDMPLVVLRYYVWVVEQ